MLGVRRSRVEHLGNVWINPLCQSVCGFSESSLSGGSSSGASRGPRCRSDRRWRMAAIRSRACRSRSLTCRVSCSALTRAVRSASRSRVRRTRSAASRLVDIVGSDGEEGPNPRDRDNTTARFHWVDHKNRAWRTARRRPQSIGKTGPAEDRAEAFAPGQKCEAARPTPVPPRPRASGTVPSRTESRRGGFELAVDAHPRRVVWTGRRPRPARSRRLPLPALLLLGKVVQCFP